MKQSIIHTWLAVAALTGLAACSQTDTEPDAPATAGREIQFSAHAQTVTRATGDINNENITGSAFRVYGLSWATGGDEQRVFTSNPANPTTLVRWNADQQLWYNDQMTLWEDGRTYAFAAIYPATDDFEVNDDVSAREISLSHLPAVQVVANADGTAAGTDWLMALVPEMDYNAERDNTGRVALTFRHLLSRLSVMVENTDEFLGVRLHSLRILTPTGVTFAMSNSQMDSESTTFHFENNYQPATGSWRGGDTPEGYESHTLFDDTAGGEALEVTDTPQTLRPEFFLAPHCEEGQPPLHFEIVYTADDAEGQPDRHDPRTVTQYLTLTDAETVFKSGYQHNLHLQLAAGRIRFYVEEVEAWQISEEFTPVELQTGDWIDMGSAGKWATTDLGASRPFVSGDGYFWAARKPADAAFWEIYPSGNTYPVPFRQINPDNVPDEYDYIDSDGVTYTKYNLSDNLTTLQKADDPAANQWGTKWRTPTRADWEKLTDRDKFHWNFEDAYTVTGDPRYSDGNHVFGTTITCIEPGPCYGHKLFLQNDHPYWTSDLPKEGDVFTYGNITVTFDASFSASMQERYAICFYVSSTNPFTEEPDYMEVFDLRPRSEYLSVRPIMVEGGE